MSSVKSFFSGDPELLGVVDTCLSQPDITKTSNFQQKAAKLLLFPLKLLIFLMLPIIYKHFKNTSKLLSNVPSSLKFTSISLSE
jgi:hypothetical protein